MPAQDRVGRKQGTDLGEAFSTQDLPFDCQARALIVVQENPLFAQFLFQDLIFAAQVFDQLLLLSMDPGRQDHAQKLPRLQDEVHGQAAT